MPKTKKQSSRKIRDFFHLLLFVLILFLYAYYETHIKEEEKEIIPSIVSSMYEIHINAKS